MKRRKLSAYVRKGDGAQTHLVIDEGGEGEEIEQVGEEPPHVSVSVFAETLVVEAVDLCNLSRLVVSPEDRDAVAVSKLHGDEEGDGLDRVITTVDVVTHEEVVCVWRVAPDAEKLGKIVLHAITPFISETALAAGVKRDARIDRVCLHRR